MEETPRSGSVRYKQGEAGLCIFPEAMAGNDPSLCRVKSELQGGVGGQSGRRPVRKLLQSSTGKSMGPGETTERW